MPHLDRAAILEAVHQLSAAEQEEIARANLATLARREPPPAPPPARGSAAALRGIAQTDQPLDDDKLLDESRTERYG